MRWTSILTPLILTGTSGYLVLVEHWDTLRAFMAVGVAGLLLPLILLAVILPFVKPEERPAFWGVVFSTARKDLEELTRWLRPKR
jgi:hypothetical protein